MLKEAYSIITDKDGNGLSPYQIEKYLIDEEVLANRVLDLFTNYRQQWRNPSTHNHKLFFGEQEALLAIVSVSAFVNILLDQIIETISYKTENDKLKLIKQELDAKLESYEESPFQEQVTKLVMLFNYEILNSKTNLAVMREIELIGRLKSFFNSFDPLIEVFQEMKISNHQMRPDLVLSKNGINVVIEVKRPGVSKHKLEYSLQQISMYLNAGNYEFGIVYLPPVTKQEVVEVTEYQIPLGTRTAKVYVISSKEI
jgi:hypothetical protein